MASWKAESDKDRRTRMAASSVNQPMKKGGAGAYTWGNIMEVQDYEPVGSTITKVSTAPVYTTPAPAQVVTNSPYKADASQFPSLGSVAVPIVSSTWGPACSNPGMVTQATTIRTGVDFDASHPRNAFARKPRVTTGGTITTELAPQASIDWSAPGVAAVQRQVIQSSSNAAHLSPYQASPASQPLTADQLRMMSGAVSTSGYPKVTKQVFQQPHVPKPKVIQQPRGR